jgi:hypothetical protein
MDFCAGQEDRIQETEDSIQKEPPTDHPAPLGSYAGRGTMDTDERAKSFHAKAQRAQSLCNLRFASFCRNKTILWTFALRQAQGWPTPSFAKSYARRAGLRSQSLTAIWVT